MTASIQKKREALEKLSARLHKATEAYAVALIKDHCKKNSVNPFSNDNKKGTLLWVYNEEYNDQGAYPGCYIFHRQDASEEISFEDIYSSEMSQEIDCLELETGFYTVSGTALVPVSLNTDNLIY